MFKLPLPLLLTLSDFTITLQSPIETWSEPLKLFRARIRSGKTYFSEFAHDTWQESCSRFTDCSRWQIVFKLFIRQLNGLWNSSKLSEDSLRLFKTLWLPNFLKTLYNFSRFDYEVIIKADDWLIFLSQMSILNSVVDGTRKPSFGKGKFNRGLTHMYLDNYKISVHPSLFELTS